MRLAGLLVVVAAAALPACAQSPATQPVDPLEQSRLLDQQIRKLTEETLLAKEAGELADRLTKMRSTQDKEREQLQDRLRDIWATPQWRQYEDKLNDLRAKFGDQWAKERQILAQSAEPMYSARHAEIRRLSPAKVTEAGALKLSALNYPSVDGSTSTQPLSVIIAARVLDTSYSWVYARHPGGRWGGQPAFQDKPALLDGVPILLRKPVPSEEERMEFQFIAARVEAKPSREADAAQERTALMINQVLAASTSTHDAYVRVIEGKCDLNLSARAPSPSESKLAGEKKVKLVMRPIALDALVFIVNERNPVKSLSLKELRSIYMDKITRWKDLGGNDEEISALRRESESGSRELFDSLVMKGAQLPEPVDKGEREVYSYTMAGPFNRVTEQPATIAYSVYYYEHFMAMSPLTRNLAIDGVEPTPETIASGKYPLVAPVYAVYRADQPKDSPAVKLVDWLLSPEGQAVVRASGYVPVK